MLSPSVFIVILNWNNSPDSLACLESLESVRTPAVKIIIVDNGSSDNSVSLIQDAYPWTTILRSKDNLGYAGGNNVGIRHAIEHDADYVCILNNDVIVSSGFLIPLIEAFNIAPDIGVVTPLIAEHLNQDQVWSLGSSVDHNTGAVVRNHAGKSRQEYEKTSSFDIDVASGAAMMIRRDVFDHVGLLDEDFFLYYEETDWCLFAKQFGYRILAVPNSIVWHKVSATLGTTSPVIDYYMLRNHLRLISRHGSRARRSYLLTRTVARNLAIITAYTVKSHHGKRIPNRNARLLALRDALLRRWGKMGPDVAVICYQN